MGYICTKLNIRKMGFQSFVYFMIMENEFGIYTIHYNVMQRIECGRQVALEECGVGGSLSQFGVRVEGFPEPQS